MSDVLGTIKVKYKHTTVPYFALKWLNELPDVFSADFESTGLGSPIVETLTHFSVAWSEDEGFVLPFTNPMMEKVVMEFLTTTKKKQIWHNLSFDGKYIMHRTGKFPINYEDTQVLAWSLLNHSDVFKAKSGLKELMGWKYGEWGIAKDMFGLEYILDPKMIEYSAIDAMATYALWNDIQEQLND